MRNIFKNKNLFLLTFFTCFFVMNNLHAKVAVSRTHQGAESNAYVDLDREYIDQGENSNSRSLMDLYSGMGEFSLNQASVLSLDELKKDIRDLKINVDETKGEVTLFGSVPVVCSEHLKVEAVRPSSLTDVRVGFRVSDFTGNGRACLLKARGKTCEALGGCVSFDELMQEDSYRFQASFRLPDFKTKRVVVTVQTKIQDKSKILLSWSDYGSVETVRFKSKVSEEERNLETSRLGKHDSTNGYRDHRSDNEYARTYIGKRKSISNCNGTAMEQVVFIPQASAPMMSQPMMQPMVHPQPMMQPRPMMPPPVMPPVMPPMMPPFARPMPQVLPPPMGFRPPMPQVFPPFAPRPPMVMPPFVNGGCPGACVGGFRPGVIPPNQFQTLPAIRYPQINYPRNNFQLSLNANFGF